MGGTLTLWLLVLEKSIKIWKLGLCLGCWCIESPSEYERWTDTLPVGAYKVQQNMRSGLTPWLSMLIAYCWLHRCHTINIALCPIQGDCGSNLRLLFSIYLTTSKNWLFVCVCIRVCVLINLAPCCMFISTAWQNTDTEAEPGLNLACFQMPGVLTQTTL